MQTNSLMASLIFALKLSLCLCGSKFISGVQSLRGSSTYGFPSETISAISFMPSSYSPKRSSYFDGSTTKNGSPSTVVAIPLYIRGSKQSKPPMLFDILSSSLTESLPKNRKFADIKPKSISSSYEPQQKYGIKQEQYQTEQKKLDEYANYASAAYSSGEKPSEGLSSQTYNPLQQNLKPYSNNKISSQKLQSDYSDMTPALDRFGVSKQTDAQNIYDSNISFSLPNDGDSNGEKILNKKRENLSYGSNHNIGSYSSLAYDSVSSRPSNTVSHNSALSQNQAEVSSPYSPFLRNVGVSNSGYSNYAQINSHNSNAMSGNSADNIYSAASTYYNPAKHSYNSPYVTTKPYSYNAQENYNVSPNMNEYNSETNNGEIKDNFNNYDYSTNIAQSTKKINGFVTPSSNTANSDSYGKQTSSSGYMAKLNDYGSISDGECYDSKAIHSSEHSFSAIPQNDDQKAIPLKSLHAQMPTQTSSLTSDETDEIDPTKLDLKIVHLPISVLRRLVASGELGLPSFQ